MGAYRYISKLYQDNSESLKQLWQQRLAEWRKEGSVTRIDHPTRIDRAHALGYKAKQGYIIVRVKVLRGGRMRATFNNQRRRPKHSRRMEIIGKSYQWIAEERAASRYMNCEVINSYEAAKDGMHYWFEVILADRAIVSKYPGMAWLSMPKHKGRVFRGKTSAARRSRGLVHKGLGTERIRPSLKANQGKAK